MENLSADIAVMQSLSRDEVLNSLTEGRIFNTCRPEFDEKEDKVPYIVVSYEGMANDSENKDAAEGWTDKERITVLCVAQDRIQLCNLINTARRAVRSYLNSSDCLEMFGVQGYEISASAIICDWTVPCTYQSLNYNINTYNQQ